MRQKYSKEKLDTLIECLNTDGFTPSILEDLLSEENKDKIQVYNYLQELALSDDDDLSQETQKEISDFDDFMLEDFSVQIAKEDFRRIEEVKDSKKRAKIVKAILDNPREYPDPEDPDNPKKCAISNAEMVDLIMITGDVDYIHDWIILSQDLQVRYGVDFASSLTLAMDELEQKQMLEDIEEAKKENYQPMYGADIPEEKGSLGYIAPMQRKYEDFNGFYEEGIVFDKGLRDLAEGENPLHYSEKEKEALMIYEGSAPGGCAIANDSNSYKTLNTVMFPGIENELTRIFEDHHVISPTILFQTHELLNYYHNLHSVMQKQSYQIQKALNVKRVDRTQSFDEILERKELVSSFSTTLNYFPKEFSKKHITLVEAQVMPGAFCVDFERVLGDEYQHYMEREVLVGAGSPVEVEKIVPQEDLNEYEKDIHASDGSLPDQKIVLRVLPLPKAKEPTEKETKQNEKNKEFVLNWGNRDRVATFMARLGNMGGRRITKERALEIIPQEEIDFYIKWKEALQSVVKFDLEKTRFEIDKQVEEYRRIQKEKVDADRSLDAFKVEAHEILEQEKQAEQEQQEPDFEDEEISINEQGHSKFKEPDFDEKEEVQESEDSPRPAIQSSEIARQMISEYKAQYASKQEPSEHTTITIEQLDGLAKTRKLSGINKAITTFKGAIGKIVGKKQSKDTKEKKNTQKKNDMDGRE